MVTISGFKSLNLSPRCQTRIESGLIPVIKLALEGAQTALEILQTEVPIGIVCWRVISNRGAHSDHLLAGYLEGALEIVYRGAHWDRLLAG